MPNLTPKSFYIGNQTAGNVYTTSSTAGNYSIIKNINICNTSNTANATASMHILVNGAAASSNNKIISNALVIANDVLYYNTSIVIPSNSNVYVSTSSNTLTFSINGVEYA